MPRWRRFRFKRRLKEILELEGKVIFFPHPLGNSEPITLTSEELAALKLKDIENKTLDEIGVILEVSRAKASELLRQAREKLARALIERRPIIIETE